MTTYYVKMLKTVDSCNISFNNYSNKLNDANITLHKNKGFNIGEHSYYVGIVELPVNNPDLKIIDNGATIKTNMFVLREKYDVETLEGVKEILKITDGETKHIINKAAKNGNVEILEWIKNSDYAFNYDETTLEIACEYGKLNVLQWAQGNRVYLKFNVKCFNYALKNGNIDILTHIKNSDFKIELNEFSFINACSNGRVESLEWLKNNNYEFEQDLSFVKTACKEGHLNVLEWLNNHFEGLNYDNECIKCAFQYGHIDILDWFKNNFNVVFYYDPKKYVKTTKMRQWLNLNGVVRHEEISVCLNF